MTNPLAWDDIRYFLALAEAGSLAGAARALAVEHSTVARRIAQLEAQLQLRLFDRLARGWRLSAEGLALQSRAQAVAHEVHGLQRAAAGLDVLSGTVTLSAPPLLLQRLVLPALHDSLARHPELSLELIGEPRRANVLGAEVDLALRLGPVTEPDLVARPLGRLRYSLYGTPEALRRPPAEQVFIGHDDSLPELPQKRWLDRHVGARRYRCRSNDLETQLQAACAGWGIALLPDFAARGQPGLQRAEAAQAPLQRPLNLVLHADLRRSPRVRVVADCLALGLGAALQALD